MKAKMQGSPMRPKLDNSGGFEAPRHCGSRLLRRTERMLKPFAPTTSVIRSRVQRRHGGQRDLEPSTSWSQASDVGSAGGASDGRGVFLVERERQTQMPVAEAVAHN
jgi:hypothetical protein